MANQLVIKRLDRITLVRKSGGKLAKHPKLRDGVVELVKADTVAPTFDEALRVALHGPEAVQKATRLDLAGLTFDEALKLLLHT